MNDIAKEMMAMLKSQQNKAPDEIPWATRAEEENSHQ